MGFLERERAALNKFVPGLDEILADCPLSELERPGSPGIEAFRKCGGPGLLAPVEHGGAGATPLHAIRVQRAVGARSPSLAVATAMHHFSMASLVELSKTSDGFEWMLMEAVARGSKLLASGFAEGRADANILEPTMTAVAEPGGGVRVSGVKRPCSLSRSMDLLTASVRVPRLEGEGSQLAVVLVPSDAEGVTVSPFWGSFALAGAESEQVTLDSVLVPEDLVVRTDVPPGESLDALQVAGFLWFELVISASYLGMASALVEQVVLDERVRDEERVRLVGALEAAMAGLENVARQFDGGGDQRLLTDCLLTRYSVQDAIATTVPRAVELLGGLRYISADDVAYVAACTHGLGFHPPSRARMAGALAGALRGAPLTIR